MPGIKVKKTRLSFELAAIAYGIVVFILLLLWGNPFYMFISMAVLAFIIYCTAIAYIPPVLFFILFYHWVQVFSNVIGANYTGNEINYNSPNSGNAVILSYIGIVIMTLIFRWAITRLPFGSLDQMKKSARELSINNVMIAYIIMYFVAGFLSSISFALSGLTQIIFSIIQLKWAAFTLFAYMCILRREKYIFLVAAICFEFLSGLYSYFSSFKEVIFYAALIGFTFVTKVNFKQLIIASVLGVLLFGMAVFWQTIKQDYRGYLRQDVQEQVVNVSQSDAYDRLLTYSDKYGLYEYNLSILTVLYRIGYTYHFALVMDRVPKVIPHTYGKLWMDNLEFVFTPRALNPNKPTLDASTKTNQYAGTTYATAAEGASFSLGYFAEGYVDFGGFGMFFPIIVIAFAIAAGFNNFIRTSSSNMLLNFSVVMAMFMPFSAYESDAIFLTGRLAITLITFYLLKKFLIKWSMPFLR